MRETLSSEFREPNGDFLTILDALEIAVHADGPKIEARDAECLAANFAVPAIKSPEVQIRRSVRQAPGLDRVGVVNQSCCIMRLLLTH